MHFICDRVPIRVERNDLVWTQDYLPQQIITLPIAHGEGCYYADADTLQALEDGGQVLFRYCSPTGAIDSEHNPNGSADSIAGIINQQGNVLGMMPHPERASDSAVGSTDGLAIFKSLLAKMAAV